VVRTSVVANGPVVNDLAIGTTFIIAGLSATSTKYMNDTIIDGFNTLVVRALASMSAVCVIGTQLPVAPTVRRRAVGVMH
jgi:hypothetical protein